MPKHLFASRLPRALVAIFLSAALAASALAQTVAKVRVDIAAQDLSSALTQFGRETGTEIVFAPDVVRQKTATAVKGEFERERAIELLLNGTGLTYRVTPQGAIVVEPEAGAGSRERNTAFTRSSGIRLAQNGAGRQRTDDGSAAQGAGGGGQGEARANEERTSLEQIIVSARRATTATKTDTPLIETPQAISVITADQFLDRGALLFEETLRYSAGVNPESFGTDPRLSNAVVRGFIPTDYLDGLRRVFGFALLGRLDVYTLERVEVLRGPSSVLYGAGSAGGLINHVSKRAQFDPAAQFGVQYGSYDRKQFQFDVTGPLGDALAARLVGVARESDTQVDFVSDDRLLLMPTFTWRAGENTELTLLGLWHEDEFGLSPQFPPLAASLLAPPGRRLPDDFFGGEPGFDKSELEHRSVTLLADHRFSDTLRLSSSARYVDVTSSQDIHFVNAFEDQDPSTPAIDPFIDPDNQLVPRFVSSEDQAIDVFATDNRLGFDFATGALSHKFLAGVDYQRFVQAGASGGGTNVPLNIYAPVYGNIPADVTLFPYPEQRVSQLGVYLQDQIDYAERVHIVLGARRDRAASRTEGQTEQVDHATTFRAAFIADVWEGLSPYVSYAESFIPVAGFSTFNQDPFVPQEGTMYEVGIKWQPAPQTLLTLAAFDIRETNRFTNHPTDPTLLIQQGEVESRGAEIEAAHRFFGSLDLTATYSFVDAEISESNNPAEIGLQLDVTPEHQATIWGVNRFDIGADTTLRIGAGARYIGEHFSSGTLRLPSYTLVDALVAVDRGQWSLSVNANNLLDERHYSTCLARGDCFPGVRRNVVGMLSYQF